MCAIRSWSNICKSNALADSGRISVGPTSSVKGFLASYMRGMGVCLLGNLMGSGVISLLGRCTVEVVVEQHSQRSDKAVMASSPPPSSSSTPHSSTWSPHSLTFHSSTL